MAKKEDPPKEEEQNQRLKPVKKSWFRGYENIRKMIREEEVDSQEDRE